MAQAPSAAQSGTWASDLEVTWGRAEGLSGYSGISLDVQLGRRLWAAGHPGGLFRDRIGPEPWEIVGPGKLAGGEQRQGGVGAQDAGVRGEIELPIFGCPPAAKVGTMGPAVTRGRKKPPDPRLRPFLSPVPEGGPPQSRVTPECLGRFPKSPLPTSPRGSQPPCLEAAQAWPGPRESRARVRGLAHCQGLFRAHWPWLGAQQGLCHSRRSPHRPRTTGHTGPTHPHGPQVASPSVRPLT